MSKIVRLVISVVGLFLIVTLLAFGAGWPAAASTTATTHLVTVQDFSFDPNAITIDTGDTVQWDNVQGIHNVVADDGSFDSGPAAPAPWTFSHTFDIAGTFAYYCSVHGAPGGIGMAGVVTVTDPTTPTNSPMATATPTNTPMATATPTSTPMATATPTSTSMATATPTSTPMATATATSTPTATPSMVTPTPTASPTEPPLPESVEIAPSKDNTLYEQVDGALSNGAGQHFFAGTTGSSSIRRGLLAFDLADALPPGAQVVSATLTLYMSRTISGDQPVELRRLLTDWGEGDSQAGGEEGGGAAAAAGDATWLHTFFDTDFWTTPGGDFADDLSALTMVGGIGSYTWSSDQMRADVQSWLDDPTTNFGWLLLGNEAASATAKRFNTREHVDAATRPLLTIVYMLPPYGVMLSPPSADISGEPGAAVTYTLFLSNTGTLSDTFNSAAAGNIWPTDLLPSSVSLAAGTATTITVTVTIPDDVVPNVGISDTVIVTATSGSDPQIMDSSQLTTTAVRQTHLFLPLITRP